jgi:hypothetical protein
MGLADEIKRLGSESQTVQDQLSNSSVEFVLKHCHSAVSKELETYATVMEGLKKVCVCFCVIVGSLGHSISRFIRDVDPFNIHRIAVLYWDKRQRQD